MDQAKRVILEIFKKTLKSFKQEKDYDDSVRSHLFYHSNKVKTFMLAMWRDYETAQKISLPKKRNALF